MITDKKIKIVLVESGASTGDEIITMSDGTRYYKEPCFEPEIIDGERFYIKKRTDDVVAMNLFKDTKSLYVKRKHRVKQVSRGRRYYHDNHRKTIREY